MRTDAPTDPALSAATREDRPADEGTTGFVRAMTLTDETLLAVGTMIGSGIFLVSAGIARAVGSPAGLLAAWAVTGVMTILGALAYGEMAAMYPQAAAVVTLVAVALTIGRNPTAVSASRCTVSGA